MSVNAQIENALAGIASHIWFMGCPLEKPPEEYILYNPEFEEPVLRGDNEDGEWAVYMQVHLYTKKNYFETKKRIRKALRKEGFIINDIVILYERDTRYYHLCFSCSIEEQENELWPI